MSDSATPWTVAFQPSQSMEFSRQEYWSGYQFPSLRDLSDPGVEPGSLALQADSLPSEPPVKPTLYRTVKYTKAQPLAEDTHMTTMPDT